MLLAETTSVVVPCSCGCGTTVDVFQDGSYRLPECGTRRTQEWDDVEGVVACSCGCGTTVAVFGDGSYALPACGTVQAL